MANNEEAVRLNDEQDDSETETDAITIIKSDKTFCGCCDIFGAFNAYSSYYLIVGVMIFPLYGLWAMGSANTSVVCFLDTRGCVSVAYYILIIFSCSFLRFIVSIIGFVITSILKKNKTISFAMANVWGFLILWTPIIFSTLFLIQNTIVLQPWMGISDWNESDGSRIYEYDSRRLVISIFTQIWVITDVIIGITFYVTVKKYIESTTNIKVYVCPCCRCC
eukprot:375335_1